MEHFSKIEELKKALKSAPRSWLVTGAGGFVGSHLVEALLHLGQRVAGLDNFATGHRRNLADVRARVGEAAWGKFSFVEGDITSQETCLAACSGVEFVLHQAALGSIPRSLRDPRRTHRANVDGFLNMLTAARETKVRRFVYASSSSVYGDREELPRVEARIGRPLSPYALTKSIGEQYAEVFSRCFGAQSIGLRYFNVFGPRQNPAGEYSAVIPRWIGQLSSGKDCVIFGDGESSRDFCYVENVVQANLLAATAEDPAAVNQVYNVACGAQTALKELFVLIRDGLAQKRPELRAAQPRFEPFRPGDVRHSRADISKAARLLGYAPSHSLRQGLAETLPWYANRGLEWQQ